MICYLIPTCITCIKQESLLKSKPNPSINIRYISMEKAKKSKYTFPLWQKGNKKYEGILVCKKEKMDGIFDSKHSQKVKKITPIPKLQKKSCFGSSNPSTGKEVIISKKIAEKIKSKTKVKKDFIPEKVKTVKVVKTEKVKAKVVIKKNKDGSKDVSIN